MDVLLIKDGVVYTCICADSVQKAQQFYPDYICMERTEDLQTCSPGDLYDGVNFTRPEVTQWP